MQTHHHHLHQGTPDVIFALERKKSKELLIPLPSVEHVLNTLTRKNLPLPPDWLCPLCSTESLPFSTITNDDLLLTLNGCDAKTTDFLKDVPTFSIQSLIGQLPGENFDTDDFISDTVESKYYTPAEFITTKFKKRSFSLMHLNIASLQAHIDELRTLLTLLSQKLDFMILLH